MPNLVAIHQPNFFPWLGYFDKIRRADTFVFLDAVDYPRSGSGGMGSWCNRVRISIQGEASWITCPLQRLPLGSPITAATIDDRQPWRKKLLKTLEANYRRAPRYAATMDLLAPLVSTQEENLAAFNIAAITSIATYLGLTTRFLRQSGLRHSGHATERLVSLVKEAGGMRIWPVAAQPDINRTTSLASTAFALSLKASRLRHTVSGRAIYRDSPSSTT